MSAKLGFERHQNQRGQQHHHGRVADGQQVQPENAQQQHQRSQRAGNNRAGRIEFQIDEQRADHQQQKGDIGIHQPAQQLLAQ